MKKILLAVDGSACANDAASFLARLPHDEKLELTVLTVLDDPAVVHGYAATISMNELVHKEKESALAAYQAVKARFLGSKVELRSIIDMGHRGETIVRVANDFDVELVIVGARGHSMISRLILGSTSDYVATHAHCSVLVVRPTGFLSAKRPLRVVVGYDSSGPAQAALEEFADIPWERDTEVHLVNVVAYMTGSFNDVVLDREPLLIAARAEVAKAVRQLQSAVPSATGDVVDNEHAGEGLVRFAEDKQSDLIVVGEAHRSALRRFLLGSFSRYVLRHAPCSVWISRNRTIHGIGKREVDMTKQATELAAS